MNELSLFTGIGGSVLAGKDLGWRCVGAVEIEPYPCAVLRERQIDGQIPEFPIWCMDITEFNKTIAPSYTGMVDILTAGPPCTDFSSAGKREQEKGKHNMWPETIRTISVVRPKYCLLENVAGFAHSEYALKVYGQIASLGYDLRWAIIPASAVGAPYQHENVWIVAKAAGANWGRQIQEFQGDKSELFNSVYQRGEAVAASPSKRCGSLSGHELREKLNNHGSTEKLSQINVEGQPDSKGSSPAPWASRRPELSANDWWDSEPPVVRVVSKYPFRVDRVKALGNCWVPQQAVLAWQTLTEKE